MQQADKLQLDSLAGEWQAYHDAETAALREQLEAAQGQLEAAQAAAGEAPQLREQLQQLSAVSITKPAPAPHCHDERHQAGVATRRDRRPQTSGCVSPVVITKLWC